VLEGVSSMLLDASLPFEYWGLAAQCFIYLKNRSPHHALFRSTPYTEWHQKLPDLTNVRIFGSSCFVYIPHETRKKQGLGNKLLPKSEKMIFVGYSDKYKAWKCINPTTKVITFSSNVVFRNELEQRPANNVKITLYDHAAPSNSFAPADLREAGKPISNSASSDEGEEIMGNPSETVHEHQYYRAPERQESPPAEAEIISDTPLTVSRKLPESNQIVNRELPESSQTVGPYQVDKL
jgi:hypothetical protein